MHVREVALAWGAATDTGQRAENQDSLLARPPVFAVADGMGGHAAGRQASVVAVERLARTVEEVGEDAGPGQVLTVDLLRTAIQRADADIRRAATSLGDARGMGTTVAGIALVVDDGQPRWAVFHIGDSRVYRLAGSGLAQLSTDHSVVQELVDAGMITTDAAAVHPQRHLVTRALGVGAQAQADIALLPVEPAQRFLICSDGLTGELRDEEIADLLARAPDAEAAAEELVRTAATRGASDNVTAVVVEVQAVREPAPEG
ncbi:MAG: protein serine/threonine phosphatase [Frankiales bacterium]|nr:protein serine/threonine phosphatase [Frankiales bacterium]